LKFQEEGGGDPKEFKLDTTNYTTEMKELLAKKKKKISNIICDKGRHKILI
jgi:hypothetical protein